MAKQAKAGTVAADMQPPDFRGAVNLLRHAIPEKKTKISSLNGEVANIYDRIVNMKVPKASARVFMMADKMEPKERADFFRGFNGLCDASGWADTEEDIVDKAENKAVHLRMTRPVDPDQLDDDPDGSDGDDDGLDADPAPAASAKTFTGDNSDLARPADAPDRGDGPEWDAAAEAKKAKAAVAAKGTSNVVHLSGGGRKARGTRPAPAK